jgi:hypothetical protein
MKENKTFERAITPSKLMALFLAVNKSSAHPEMSSCQQLYQTRQHKHKRKTSIMKSCTYKFRGEILSHVLISVLLPLSYILRTQIKLDQNKYILGVIYPQKDR